LALTTLFFGSATIVLSLFLPSRWVSLICGTFWARLNAWLTPMPVKVTGRENIDPQQSYVVVANHQSFYDIFVLYGFLGIDFKWVMKQEMRSIPGLGIGCEKVGHIFVDRSNRKAALASIKSAQSKISNGTSVVFFPEGTRSLDGTLKGFKKGAFRFALDLDLPILPVTIVGAGDVLLSGSLDLLPGKVRLIIDEPISVDGLDVKDVPHLMEQVRSVFEANLPN
jgi:1-acyl-sn-glycerol-3-phosphate acyltransferase